MLELRLAARRLVRSPTYALLSILTLSLGVGVATATYSLLRAVLAPPSGVQRPEALIEVFHAPGGPPSFSALSWPDYQDLKSTQTVFSQMTAWASFSAAFTFSGKSATRYGEIVDANYFRVLGVSPEEGRLFEPSDERPGAVPVAVLSYHTWTSLFDGQGVVGRALTVNGKTFEIIGVADRHFAGLFEGGLVPSALWLPLSSGSAIYRQAATGPFDRTDRDSRWLRIVGSLDSGQGLAAAKAQVEGIARRLDITAPLGLKLDPQQLSSPYQHSRPWLVRRMVDVHVDEGSGPLVTTLAAATMIAVLAVLLVACTNLANLTFARSVGRHHELVVRAALGASSGQLLAASVIEGALLAALAGPLSLVVARACIRMLSGELQVHGTVATIILTPNLDWRALVVAVCATGLAIFVACVAPAIRLVRTRAALSTGTEQSRLTPNRSRARYALIAAQVMVSVVLLAVAALSASETREQGRAGRSLSGLALAEVDFESQGYADGRSQAVLSDLQRRLSLQAGALSFDMTTALPSASPPLVVLTDPVADRSAAAGLVSSTPGLLAALRIPILQGSLPASPESTDAQVAVLSESAARVLFGSASALGRTVRISGENARLRSSTRLIVGVSADADSTLPGSRAGVVYIPFEHASGTPVMLIAHSPAGVNDAVNLLLKTLKSIDPSLVVRASGPASDLIASGVQFFEIASKIASALGIFAWVLALLGLYGLITQLVALRIREIGLRLVLGATRGNVLVMLMRQGLAPVLAGGAAGAVVAFLARHAFQGPARNLLPSFEFGPLAIVALTLASIATAACYLPVRSALRSDPARALNQS